MYGWGPDAYLEQGGRSTPAARWQFLLGLIKGMAAEPPTATASLTEMDRSQLIARCAALESANKKLESASKKLESAKRNLESAKRNLRRKVKRRDATIEAQRCAIDRLQRRGWETGCAQDTSVCDILTSVEKVCSVEGLGPL